MADAAVGLAPAALQPLVSVASNKDVFGNKIVPEPDEHQQVPPHELYHQNVSRPSKEITDAVAKATDGTAVRTGSVDVSPEWLDYAYDYVTGGAGRFFGRLTKLVTDAAHGKLDPNQAPILHSYTGERQSESISYEHFDKAEKAISKELEAAKAGEPYDRQIAELTGARSTVMGEIQKLRKARKQAPDEATKKQIDARIQEMQDQLSKAYETVKQ